MDGPPLEKQNNRVKTVVGRGQGVPSPPLNTSTLKPLFHPASLAFAAITCLATLSDLHCSFHFVWHLLWPFPFFLSKGISKACCVISFNF